jgi:hypothetical protein
LHVKENIKNGLVKIGQVRSNIQHASTDLVEDIMQLSHDEYLPEWLQEVHSADYDDEENPYYNDEDDDWGEDWYEDEEELDEDEDSEWYEDDDEDDEDWDDDDWDDDDEDDEDDDDWD